MELDIVNPRFPSLYEGTNLSERSNDVSFEPLPIEDFQNKLPEEDTIKNFPRKIRKYYTKQYEIIKSFDEVKQLVGHMPRYCEVVERENRNSLLPMLDTLTTSNAGVWRGNRLSIGSIEPSAPTPDGSASNRKSNASYLRSKRGQTFLAKLTLVCNFILMVAKLAAAIMSMSLSVISSLLDSCVDLLSGGVLWWTAKKMKNSNIRLYPYGRTRLEPIAIIILAVIMSVASFQMIREGVERIISIVNDTPSPSTIKNSTIEELCQCEKGIEPEMTNAAIGITAATILVKIILFTLCFLYGESSSVAALATDNRNDVFSNSVALVFSTLSSRLGIYNLKYLDPIGAIIVAIYIIFSWFQTGREHVQSLTGIVASPEFHQKLCYLVLSHHPSILEVDTIVALHFGQNYLVEVHVVLPENMCLSQAHNIGEALQTKLEALPEVERAFVHLDYESVHPYAAEHKVVA